MTGEAGSDPPAEPCPELPRHLLVRGGRWCGDYLGLVAFQGAGPRQTYADFRSNPCYRDLAEFFFKDVYSEKDKSDRDLQFKHLYETFRRRLGVRITHGVGDLVRLNDFSNELDYRLVDVFVSMDADLPINDETYEEAYRRCDNHEERVEQIVILERGARYFFVLGQMRSIGFALMAVKAAAKVFGGEIVIGFLDRGYHAYRSVTREEVDAFANALVDREMRRLDRIYGRPAAKAVSDER